MRPEINSVDDLHNILGGHRNQIMFEQGSRAHRLKPLVMMISGCDKWIPWCEQNFEFEVQIYTEFVVEQIEWIESNAEGLWSLEYHGVHKHIYFEQESDIVLYLLQWGDSKKYGPKWIDK